MKNWINYHHLFYFKAIAEHGSVSQAAHELRLGQPTLSAQLKQFEEALGISLFERQHKRLVLTEQGRVALDYARSIFKLGSEMYEVLHDRMVPARTHLQLGALDSVPKQITLQLTQAAYEIGPCMVSVMEGKGDEILRELSAHHIDLFVSNYLPTVVGARSLQHRLVCQRPVGIYGAARFKKLRRGFPKSLDGQKFVLPTYDSKLRSDVDHWSHAHDITLDVVAESQDIGLKKLMAVEGLGLIPAATHTVARQVESGELVEIGMLLGVSEQLFLISAPRKIANPIAGALMKSFSI